MRDYFSRQIEIAQRNGVEKIFLDPGLGFYYRNLQDSAVRVRHQMNIFLNTFRLRALGFPICHALPHAFEFFGDGSPLRRAVFRRARRAGQNRFVPHARSSAHQGRAGYDENFLIRRFRRLTQIYFLRQRKTPSSSDFAIHWPQISKLCSARILRTSSGV